MRILTLVILFTAGFYYFIPRHDAGEEIDILKVKVSAPERTVAQEPLPVERPKKVPTPVIEIEEDEPRVEENAPEEYAERFSHADAAAAAVEVEHFSEEGTPEDELEAGWNQELRESLMMLEPDRAEDMYYAYESEKKALLADFEQMVQQFQHSPDLEYMLRELEQKHDERLKEIFGRHYEEINALRSSYLEYRSSSN